MTQDLTWDVGVDIDGVLYPFDREMAHYASRKARKPLHHFPLATRWEFYRDWGWDEHKFHEMFIAGIRERSLLWHGEPYFNSLTAWMIFAQSSQRLHLITDRSPKGAEQQAQAATKKWLGDHGLHGRTLTFSADKTRILELAQDRNRTTFIDDKVSNVEALRAAGVHAVLIDRPWNQEATHLPRAKTLMHFAVMVAKNEVPLVS